MAIIVAVTPAVVDDALEWAKKNCPNYITNSARAITTFTYEYLFYFAVPSEALMFQLKWGSQ